MDEKTKLRQEQLIEMVSRFCEKHLDEEYKTLCVKLVEKLGRKREVPFKRGKLENWASGVIYTIGQLNFLFDESFEPYATPDEICDYFKTKKSTASNKARDIRKLLNLKLGNDEFSTELIKEYDLTNMGGDLTQVKTLRGAKTSSRLRNVGSILRSITKSNDVEDVRNDDLRELIFEIFASEGEYIEDAHLQRLYRILKKSVLISPACNGAVLYVSDTKGGISIPSFTSMDEYNLEFQGGNIKPLTWHFVQALGFLESNSNLEGILINPGIDNFFVSRDMIVEILF